MKEPIYGAVQAMPARLAVLDKLVAILQKPAVRVLEIGSYEGQSALAWSEAIEKYCGSGGAVMCIDPWRPYFCDSDVRRSNHYVTMQCDLATGRTFQRFLENIALANPRVLMDYRKGTLPETILKEELGKFDIVYIDGSHYYRDAIQDIRIGLGLVNSGGIICGDDLDRLIGDVDREHMMAHCEQDFVDGYHAGVTRAVGEVFPDVWINDGVWAMQKQNDGSWSAPKGA
jgi:predicted O-methyltransferase YrrM